MWLCGFQRAFYPSQEGGKNSCMGCFAMVCGKEQQKCHKETRIKREGKFGEKHKLGFLSSGMLNTGWGALLELV